MSDVPGSAVLAAIVSVPWSNLWPVGLAVLILVLFPRIGNQLSRQSGWRKLAAVYASRDVTRPKTIFNASGSMRDGENPPCGFQNVLRFGMDSTGLQMSLTFPFRIGFPALLIPWADLPSAKEEWTSDGYVVLRFRRAASVSLKRREEQAREILSYARTDAARRQDSL